MPQWLGPISDEEARALEELWNDLSARRPDGWSIIRGQGALVVRPRERRLGKFSVTPSSGGKFHAAYYSQREGQWTEQDHFGGGAEAAGDIMTWMVATVGE